MIPLVFVFAKRNLLDESIDFRSQVRKLRIERKEANNQHSDYCEENKVRRRGEAQYAGSYVGNLGKRCNQHKPRDEQEPKYRVRNLKLRFLDLANDKDQDKNGADDKK